MAGSAQLWRPGRLPETPAKRSPASLPWDRVRRKLVCQPSRCEGNTVCGKAALLPVRSRAESGQESPTRPFPRSHRFPPNPPPTCKPLPGSAGRGEALPLSVPPVRARTIPSMWEGETEEAAAQPQPSQCSAASHPPLQTAGWRRPAATRGAAARVAASWAVARGASSRLSSPSPCGPAPAAMLRPGAAAGARLVAGAQAACTARSSVPRTRTLASGCSLRQVTRRGSEVGQALQQRRSRSPPRPADWPWRCWPASRRGRAVPRAGDGYLSLRAGAGLWAAVCS